ncbi:tail length tape-measure protein [Escherichia phage Bp4]|uniref:Tail length tape-measure protein n=2 Tax=Gamaleyavirus Bp4 TaxID=1920757 RepID=X2KRV5_9CAUD|nr:tail length tape-measure protein [Escherichia phage Bp4]AHN83362.1 tail length tape-measure protein [Escherichia phage Bp4]AXY81353.1 tail length tape-measure protein [Escherichia phage PD38]
MNESGELLLVRLEERLKTLFENHTRERQDREKLEETLVELRDSINDIGNRLKNVEDSLAKNEPTIEEFITIKHKVVGAGIFGKWVWAGAGAIIGVLAAARREIFAWFAG